MITQTKTNAAPAENAEFAVVSFDKLSYDQDDAGKTFYYKIVEQEGTGNFNYSKDAMEYEVNVALVAGSDQLSVKVRARHIDGETGTPGGWSDWVEVNRATPTTDQQNSLSLRQ